METVSISGGAGFLGSNLVDYTIKNNMEVTIVDNLSTSTKDYLSKDAEFVYSHIENFNTNKHFDYVIRLASRPSPKDYINHPIDTLMTNSTGTKIMLDIATKENAIFFYTSSSEVYGNSTVLPIPETYSGNVNPNGLRSCYDKRKKFSEALSMGYLRKLETDVRIQRPFNVYGPRIRKDAEYGRVIPRFLCWAMSGQAIKIHSNGMQTRSFLYVDDWIDATWKILKNKKAKGQVFNTSSNKSVTINLLANIVKELTNSKSRIIHTAPRKEDVNNRCTDITKINKLLGWEPKISLKEGLQLTLNWFRDIR